MDKITKKLLKYFLIIISLVIIICFIASSIFLSKSYINQEYESLKRVAEEVYQNLRTGESPALTGVNGVLISNDNSITTLGHGKMMSLYRNVDFKSLKAKDSFSTPMGQKFLSYKYSTDIGDIIIYRSGQDSSDYLKIVYATLLVVFFISIIFSIPLIIYLGKKFTNPILKLQKASYELSNENFNVDLTVETSDEIQDLAHSLKAMAAQLERKYTLQREFIANISHDFKTPLSIIRNYSEANHDGLLDLSTSQKYSYDIIQEVDRLNTLVSDLMQLSKLQGNSVNLEKTFFNLNEFLLNIVNKYSTLCSDRNIEISLLSTEHRPIDDIDILADFNYLHRVMYNFIDNALKFSENNNRIEIMVSTSDSIKISIKDYGSGIETSMKEDIWNRYYKHAQSGGVGLGLAICAEILNKHGFEYGVISREGYGSEFYFIIPDSSIRLKGV